jgi:hypothetical protein
MPATEQEEKIMSEKIDFKTLMPDAEHILEVGKRHLGDLRGYDVNGALLTRLEANIAKTNAMLADKTAGGIAIAGAGQTRFAGFEAVKTDHAAVRKIAKWKFRDDGPSPDETARKNLGVGQAIATGQRALEERTALIVKAFANKAWRAVIEPAGVTDALVKRIIAGTEACKNGMAHKGGLTAMQRKTSDALFAIG